MIKVRPTCHGSYCYHWIRSFIHWRWQDGDRAGTDAVLLWKNNLYLYIYPSIYLGGDEYPQWLLKVKSLPGKGRLSNNKKKKKIIAGHLCFLHLFLFNISVFVYVPMCALLYVWNQRYCHRSVQKAGWKWRARNYQVKEMFLKTTR